MRHSILAILFCLISVQVSFTEPTVNLATLEWEPYIGKNLHNKGYVHELVVEAFKRSGVRADIKFFTWARAFRLVEQGLRDGLFPEYYDESRLKNFVFSDSFLGGPVGLYKRKDSNISYSVNPQSNQTKALKALEQYRFGVVRGYFNTKAFDDAKFLKKFETKNDERNLKKLYYGDVDLIFIDKYVAKHILLYKHQHFLTELEFMEPPLEIKQLHIGFSKKAKGYQTKCEAFNNGLKQLKASGELDKIFDRHFISAYD